MHHAEALGYVYNRGAASLRTASSHMVGLVVHDITNPYFAEIATTIQRELGAHERVVLLGDTGDSHERQRTIVDTVREYNVDGIIMSPAADTDAAWVADLQRWRLPCVLFSRNLPNIELDYVGADNLGGMRKQIEHLIALGHRRIAMIAASNVISTGRERLDGYLAALAEAGLEVDPALIVFCPTTREAAHNTIIQLLQQDDPPTAAACFNDVAAFGVMLALHNLGLRVGEDFSVVGFDDVSEAILWRPGLTTQRVPCENIGKTAVRLLLRRLTDRTLHPEQVILEPELMIRGTTCRPPTAKRVAAMRNIAIKWNTTS
jgi:LacI family transcriptional regulator